ncbi:MAG: glutathione synthase [Desulfobacterales bacterium]|nr:glutathione synthase [Desulfobacterales bacterium]
MILSFHPNIVADENIICAGRLPNDEDRAAICRAQAVIVSQGCSEALYRMCRKHCAQVFPNYDARFDYPGKLGQARLFKEMGVPFPVTHTFETVSSYHEQYGEKALMCPLAFPCVLKFDWGGEGEEVFLLKSAEDLEQALSKAAAAEQSGQKGFLLQKYVLSGGRSMRVAVIGDRFFSYWRVQQDPTAFFTGIKAGAVIDRDKAPKLQQAGRAAVLDFCSKTGINLAGFDLLFPEDKMEPAPLFLEINYFFGRRGLGGSFKYYGLVEKAVMAWLGNLGLSL